MGAYDNFYIYCGDLKARGGSDYPSHPRGILV